MKTYTLNSPLVDTQQDNISGPKVVYNVGPVFRTKISVKRELAFEARVDERVEDELEESMMPPFCVDDKKLMPFLPEHGDGLSWGDIFELALHYALLTQTGYRDTNLLLNIDRTYLKARCNHEYA